MLVITRVETQMSVKVFTGTLESSSLTVGDDVCVTRNGQKVVESQVTDQAQAGQTCRFLLCGPAADLVREGDRLERA